MLHILLLIVFTLFLASFFLSGDRSRRLPPGPKGWPLLGNLPQLGPKPHQTLHSLSKFYGPVLRLRFGAVDVAVASSAAVAENFLRVHDSNFSSRPPSSGAKHIAYNCQDLVFAPHGERWRTLRRMCALHLFSGRALERFRHVRAGEVARMVRGLAAASSPEGTVAGVDVGGMVNACAANALGLAVVGRRVFDDADCGAEEFEGMVVELMKVAGVFNVGDFVPCLDWLDLQGVVAKMKKLHRRFDEFLDKLIAEHRALTNERDMLSMMIRLKKEEEEEEDRNGGMLTDTNIKALLLNLFTAGTDTTSSTVEWALAQLIREPGLLFKAQNELDSVVGRARLVSESDLPNLPFLQSVVKETFRLHPPTPLSLPRIAAADCEVDGYLIRRGSTLLVNVYAIGRDPASWPDEPLAFRPERFLSGGRNEGVDVKGNDFELIPFGAGRRICVGMSLGLRMVQLMTATLVHAFEWRLPEGEVPEEMEMEEEFGLTLRRAQPLVACPLPRLAPEAYL
ncbi:Flavonoid 3'-monooxygenase [Apostasia shenzhenica]|uniref:Flavonoid 3'-monooxygenase n=1 Tax=Apostasia shenzhenica TaxID=1088818 RepID=A0A2I0AWD6_9ASPA|nr:Flavonoid 3'-monooxygenase [Apostasia shenzhenica]